MSKFCSKIRFLFLPSVLSLWLISPLQAGGMPLRTFNASYDLYQGGMHIATAELSLQRSDQSWRWRLDTRARGIYSLFFSEHPTAETTFTRAGEDIHLQQIVISNSKDGKSYESARFDWDRGSIDVLRKGKQKQLPLKGIVYDYQSIHLLAAMMHAQRQNEASFDFYRKGKLVKSQFVYIGEGKVMVNSEELNANVFVQRSSKSKSSVKYYYDAGNPMLPLRIERLKSGQGPALLVLKSVDWKL